jgi:hypothetical protein
MACAFSIWAFFWAFTRGKSKYIRQALFQKSMVLLVLRPQGYFLFIGCKAQKPDQGRL